MYSILWAKLDAWKSLKGLFEKKKQNKSESTHSSLWQEIERQKFMDHVSFRVFRSIHRPIHRSMYRSILDRLSTDMRPTCRSTVDREPTDVFGPASTDVGRRIDRDHIGRLSVNYRRDIGQLSANMSTDTMVPIDISADSRPIPWVITTAKRLIKSAYSYRINTIDRCPDRYIDLCLDQYIDRYTRWSIGTLSAKHRWSIGEVSVNANFVDR